MRWSSPSFLDIAQIQSQWPEHRRVDDSCSCTWLQNVSVLFSAQRTISFSVGHLRPLETDVILNICVCSQVFNHFRRVQVDLLFRPPNHPSDFSTADYATIEIRRTLYTQRLFPHYFQAWGFSSFICQSDSHLWLASPFVERDLRRPPSASFSKYYSTAGFFRPASNGSGKHLAPRQKVRLRFAQSRAGQPSAAALLAKATAVAVAGGANHTVYHRE